MRRARAVMGADGIGAGWRRQWGFWTLLNKGSTDKGDLGKGTAVPMADNGLERRWAIKQACAWQAKLSQGTKRQSSGGTEAV